MDKEVEEITDAKAQEELLLSELTKRENATSLLGKLADNPVFINHQCYSKDLRRRMHDRYGGIKGGRRMVRGTRNGTKQKCQA